MPRTSPPTKSLPTTSRRPQAADDKPPPTSLPRTSARASCIEHAMQSHRRGNSTPLVAATRLKLFLKPILPISSLLAHSARPLLRAAFLSSQRPGCRSRRSSWFSLLRQALNGTYRGAPAVASSHLAARTPSAAVVVAPPSPPRGVKLAALAGPGGRNLDGPRLAAPNVPRVGLFSREQCARAPSAVSIADLLAPFQLSTDGSRRGSSTPAAQRSRQRHRGPGFFPGQPHQCRRSRQHCTVVVM